VLVGFKINNRRKGGNQPIRVKEQYVNFKYYTNPEPAELQYSSSRSLEAFVALNGYQLLSCQCLRQYTCRPYSTYIQIDH
jgi:hypothetical protein